MKIVLSIALIALSFALDQPAARAADDYAPGPDSKPQEGAPKGDVTKFSFDKSEIFPGTVRDYWIYVPRQYDPAKPACLFVDQDGIQFNAPVVFDNLIARGEMPVTIGIFITPGVVKASGEGALPRFNRSYEYDGLGDNYVRFLIEELLPDAETKTAPDGRAIHLSKSGNDRAIGGSSSGAVCAFTAAWERPGAFQRVFSSVGTYVGLRGGNEYPTLVRKYEPKPLRVFLQDGSNDLNIYAGDWWMVNQEMERALTFAGYEVNHAWGDGGHNGKHATAIFPDAMRWLWRDWPQPVKRGVSKNGMLDEILLPGEEWQLVSSGYEDAGAVVSNPEGQVFFTDSDGTKTYKVAEGQHVEEVLTGAKPVGAQAFGPGGELFRVNPSDQLVTAFPPGKGEARQVAASIAGTGIAILNDGTMYIVSPDEGAGGVFFLKPTGEMAIADQSLEQQSAVTVSPDQSLLYVNSADSRWIYSYQIQPGGGLAHKQRYYWLHTADDSGSAEAGGMCVDRDGRLYVATALGVQICDQAGRVNCILPAPNESVTSLAFGGKDFDVLYAACGHRVYSRKLHARGALGFQPPNKPAAPHL